MALNSFKLVYSNIIDISPIRRKLIFYPLSGIRQPRGVDGP